MNTPLDDLRQRLPASSRGPMVSTDPALLTEFGRDWTRFWEPKPLAVAFPETVDQVLAIVRWAREYTVALVPSGGRTGLSGGAVADRGQVVVSMVRMNRVLGVSAPDRLVTAEAGTTIAAMQTEAKRLGLKYPVDFAPVETMQLGGNIATNAGGVHVVRYGMTREHVAGLKVVTGAGELLDLSLSVPKNNTGYDLRQLFVGSEGTLGLIVEATMRLVVPPATTSLTLLAAPTLDAVHALGLEARKHGTLQALEFWDAAGMNLALEHLKRPPPLPLSPWYVLAEYEGTEGARSLEGAARGGGLATASLIPTDPDTAWAIRLSIGSAVAPFTPYKNDISVPVGSLPAFLPALTRLLRDTRPDLRLVVWGHLADGNLHVNALKPPHLPPADFAHACEALDPALYRLISEHRGSISAEHGIGLLKRHALHHSRSPAELAAMRQIKTIFDPDGIMNPGKILA